MSPQELNSFPNKCPHQECKSKISQDCILGVIPRGDVPLVNVVLRCNKCKKTFGFGMAAMSVSKFISSLPEGKGLLANRGVNPKTLEKPVTEKEQRELNNILMSNPQRIIDEFRIAEEDEKFFGYYQDEGEETEGEDDDGMIR